MQFEFVFRDAPRSAGTAHGEFLTVGGRVVPLCMVVNRRARRYILRLKPDGVERVTVPRGGSEAEARRFAARHAGWLEKQFLRNLLCPRSPADWRIGSEVLFRGVTCRIETTVSQGNRVRLGEEEFEVADPGQNLRPELERAFWELAMRELPARVVRLALAHQVPVRRVQVRNQKSRWGSCSRRGTVSLNWRLIQAPVEVRDYIILHEMAHLKEMNHSRRFWREVARLCPGYREAEAWLKRNSELLR